MSLLTQGQSLGKTKHRGAEWGWSLAGACGRGGWSSPILNPSGLLLPTAQNTPHALAQMESLGAQKQGIFLYLITEARHIIPKPHQLSCARDRSTSFPYLWNGGFFAELGYSSDEFLASGRPLAAAQRLHVLNPLPCAWSGWGAEQKPGACPSMEPALSLICSALKCFYRAIICLNAPRLHPAQCICQH